MDNAIVNVFIHPTEITPELKDELLKFPVCANDSILYNVMKTEGSDYRMVLSVDIPQIRIKDLIEFTIQKLSGKKIWFQWEYKNSIGVQFIEGNKTIYCMNGSIEKGNITKDSMQETIPELKLVCNNRTSDIVEYDKGDGQVFIRQFRDDRLICFIDGTISVDHRDEGEPYIMIVSR